MIGKCQPDNKTTFENEQSYCTQCEVCNLYCKLYKYRSCQLRLNILISQGVDPFQIATELSRISSFQTGESSQSPISQNKITKKNKSTSRRGR